MAYRFNLMEHIGTVSSINHSVTVSLLTMIYHLYTCYYTAGSVRAAHCAVLPVGPDGL